MLPLLRQSAPLSTDNLYAASIKIIFLTKTEEGQNKVINMLLFLFTKKLKETKNCAIH